MEKEAKSHRASRLGVGKRRKGKREERGREEGRERERLVVTNGKIVSPFFPGSAVRGRPGSQERRCLVCVGPFCPLVPSLEARKHKKATLAPPHFHTTEGLEAQEPLAASCGL